MTTTVKYVFSVAQICNLSVSVQIVASRDDFAERGHPGRSVSPTRESRELTDVSAVGNRCAQHGRAPFRLRLHRAALYRRFPNRQRILREDACATSRRLQAGSVRHSRFGNLRYDFVNGPDDPEGLNK